MRFRRFAGLKVEGFLIQARPARDRQRQLAKGWGPRGQSYKHDCDQGSGCRYVLSTGAVPLPSNSEPKPGKRGWAWIHVRTGRRILAGYVNCTGLLSVGYGQAVMRVATSTYRASAVTGYANCTTLPPLASRGFVGKRTFENMIAHSGCLRSSLQTTVIG